MNAAEPPRLSVVIPTCTRRDLLARALDSLTEQTLSASRFEVIVVDDGSADDTLDTIARRATDSRLQLVGARSLARGTGAARNYGAHLARGEFIAFMDDDVILRNDCLENALRHFEIDDQLPPLEVVESTLLTLGTEESFLKRAAAQGFITNAIFYRRETFLRLGGFDDAFYDRDSRLFFRDDVDLGWRVLEDGGRAIQPDDVVAWHPHVYGDLAACWRHARRCMVDPLLYRKHPRRFRLQLERKRIGPLAFGRPLHRLCQLYFTSMFCAVVAWSMRMPHWSEMSLALGVISALGIRAKFQGREVLRFWEPRAMASFLIYPWWYGYWYLYGCVRFGGWGSIV